MKASELGQALIDEAMKFVGIHEEGGNNRGQMVEVFQNIISKPQDQPWCCDFVQYCVRQIDRTRKSQTVIFPTEAVMMMWLRTSSMYKMQEPEPGSIACWGHYLANGNPASTGHCGIVKEILPGGEMLVIEGNTPPTGDEISRDSDGRVEDGVYIKKRAIHVTTGSMRTLGYIRAWSINNLSSEEK